MKKILLIASVLAFSPSMIVLAPASAFAASASKLGDLSSFETIATDTLNLVNAGNMVAAEKRITDFETAWDASEPKLYAADKQEWGKVDDAADGAIKALRKPNPNAKSSTAALNKLIVALKNPAAK